LKAAGGAYADPRTIHESDVNMAACLSFDSVACSHSQAAFDRSDNVICADHLRLPDQQGDFPHQVWRVLRSHERGCQAQQGTHDAAGQICRDFQRFH
jgi:hypothetical protein